MSLTIYLTNETCPHCGHGDEVFDCNITHNLSKMADEAGLYYQLWRPKECGIETAGQLIEPITDAIDKMRLEPERFRALDSPNGWGTYGGFIMWLERLLAACVDNPKATVRANR